MVLDEGYSRLLPIAMKGLMSKYNIKPDDITKAIWDTAHDVRRHGAMARLVGMDPAKVQDPLFVNIGATGAPQALIMLVAALEEANPGDKILLASYGNGADAYLVQVTDGIKKIGTRRGIKNNLASRRELTNMGTYLRWKNLVTLEAARRPDRDPTSHSAVWRDTKVILGLYGAKCKKCGTPQFIQGGGMGGMTPMRVCVICQAKDEFEPYRFVGIPAKVASFTHDNLADSPDPPSTVAVIDWEGGEGVSLT
jgi:3-hydroxy-3-methylglutaryl CoA synthase